MAENVFAAFAISGQGMSVQRMRLSATAKNIANVNTTKSIDGQPYKREVVIARAIPGSPFEEELDSQLSLSRTTNDHAPTAHPGTYPPDYRVLKVATTTDASPPRLVYDPSHPDADESGYVSMPNINIVTEMVEMIAAQRAFEANTSVVDSAKNIARDSLEI
ncbi:MAG: flagellar basal body rod protein FlgC [Candidatus Kapabacteria bacterium]|nr:flagellar basal body rod protein FlgC [Candidatus Kapabacteria bacterium]